LPVGDYATLSRLRRPNEAGQLAWWKGCPSKTFDIARQFGAFSEALNVSTNVLKHPTEPDSANLNWVVQPGLQ
jgi:hypothetical protein